MKILLVQCPCSFGTEMPPLALAYLSSYLKKNNYNVSLLDLSIALYNQVDNKDKEYWSSNKGYCWYLKDNFDKLSFINEACYDEFINKILSFESDILGFSIQNTSVLFTLEVIKRIKAVRPFKKVILGGPNCYNISGSNQEFRLHHDLQEFSDIVVVGEGEQALLNVLSRIESGKPLDDCKGIALPKEGKWVLNGLAEPVMDLDGLPFPDFDAYDLNAYSDKNSIPLLTSRGCIMRCVFCTDTNFWRPFRYRKAENVAAEIMQLKGRYGKTFFSLNDSLINGNYKNLIRLCDMLIAKKADISWGGNFRVDKTVTLRALKKMKRAGCQHLILGVESGSNRILKLMRKGFTIEEAERFILNCHKAGINIITNWIVGFPGETEEDFMATANFITKYGDVVKKNTFSTLTINQLSYLESHKEEFGIILNSQHLGLWNSVDGENTIELRNTRLRYLEEIEQKRSRSYEVVRQTATK